MNEWSNSVLYELITGQFDTSDAPRVSGADQEERRFLRAFEECGLHIEVGDLVEASWE